MGVLSIGLLMSKDFRIYVSSPLRTEIKSKLKKQNIPIIEIQIPEAVIEKHDKIYNFYKIYLKYSDGNLQSEEYLDFVNELNSRNGWEEAKLTYLGKPYEVEIKLHGRTPVQHIERNHYSLGVKMLNGEKIKGVSRFNLIVYWRIRYVQDIITYLAQALEIYYQEDELMAVLINKRSPKLYFFEYRINDDYFKKTKKENLVVFKFRNDHSLVYTAGDIETLDENLKIAIEKSNVDESQHASLYDRYSRLNNAIYHQNLEMILSNFDLNYLARIQAFRYLYGDDGHGFGINNLLVALDTTNFKFYPIVHRDNASRLLKIDEIKGQMNGLNLASMSPLFETLAESDILASKTKTYLSEYLLKGSISSFIVDSIVYEHDTYYYSSRIKQLLGLSYKHPCSINIESIKLQLSIQ